jgi:hypothetical protein
MSNFRLIPAIDQLRQRGRACARSAIRRRRHGDGPARAASTVRSAIAGGDLTLTDDDSVAGRIESTAASGSARPFARRSSR